MHDNMFVRNTRLIFALSVREYEKSGLIYFDSDYLNWPRVFVSVNVWAVKSWFFGNNVQADFRALQ